MVVYSDVAFALDCGLTDAGNGEEGLSGAGGGMAEFSSVLTYCVVPRCRRNCHVSSVSLAFELWQAVVASPTLICRYRAQRIAIKHS